LIAFLLPLRKKTPDGVFPINRIGLDFFWKQLQSKCRRFVSADGRVIRSAKLFLTDRADYSAENKSARGLLHMEWIVHFVEMTEDDECRPNRHSLTEKQI
jgi:hypothetical protein